MNFHSRSDLSSQSDECLVETQGQGTATETTWAPAAVTRGHSVVKEAHSSLLSLDYVIMWWSEWIIRSVDNVVIVSDMSEGIWDPQENLFC